MILIGLLGQAPWLIAGAGSAAASAPRRRTSRRVGRMSIVPPGQRRCTDSLRRLRRARFQHGIDFSLGEARLAQHLDAMLAEPRLQAGDFRRGLAETRRDARQAQLALARMIDLLPVTGGFELRVDE